ncbi:MAG: helix-turn-helix protein [Firmicutes bacterium ADurb.Bin248]|nr:MAG: helix-turn-helix protein [Firmicutes bacterium ADurb.Bin248]HOG01082.1 helix-turn-helix transcriptional regulator [Clostridia bacterium]HPK14956.1 helix-turn-helix transcriptional regulator [Clostridia bacterium]
MDVAYSKAIGRNVSVLRKSKGLTQEQLSAKLQVVGCDITRSALAKIEVGQRHLYPDELKALKTVLRIHYEELFV